MPQEPTGLADRLWKASLMVLGASFALWLSVKLLLEVWWAVVIIAVVMVGIYALIQWHRHRSWQ